MRKHDWQIWTDALDLHDNLPVMSTRMLFNSRSYRALYWQYTGRCVHKTGILDRTQHAQREFIVNYETSTNCTTFGYARNHLQSTLGHGKPAE